MVTATSSSKDLITEQVFKKEDDWGGGFFFIYLRLFGEPVHS